MSDSLGLIFLILLFLAPIIIYIFNSLKTEKGFSKRLSNINLDEYYQQEKSARLLLINKVQNQCIFTKDYIRLIELEKGETPYILETKKLTNIYHYVFSKQTINAINSCNKKYITLEFTDFVYCIKDKVNQKIMPIGKIKDHETFVFDNTFINLIKKMYPSVHNDNNEDNYYEIYRTSKKHCSALEGASILWQTRNITTKVILDSLDINTDEIRIDPLNEDLFLNNKATDVESKPFQQTTNSQQEQSKTCSQQQQFNICPHCNNTLTNNTKFCSKCGLNLELFIARQENVYTNTCKKYQTILSCILNTLWIFVALLFLWLILMFTFLTTDNVKGCTILLVLASISLLGIIGCVVAIKYCFYQLYKYVLKSKYNSKEKQYLEQNETSFQNGIISKEEYIANKKNILQKITEFQYRILI